MTWLKPIRSGFLLLLVHGLAVSLPASALQAQYFGRNKVQYESFDFKVLKTEHFDVHFYPPEQEAAGHAARMAERWYARLSSVLDHELSGRQPLILYASAPEFQQTNAIMGSVGEGTGGVTEALKRRIVLPTGGTLGDLDHVIGHELVHAFQYDITGSGRPNSLGALPAASQLPLWFIEGMAEYLSIGPAAPHTAMWMRGALADTTRDSLPSLSQLEDPRFFPYRYGHAFLAWIAGHWGDQVIGQLLRGAGRRRDVAVALARTLNVNPDTLVARWHAETHAAYDPLKSTTALPETFGPRLIEARGDGRYNVSPSLSPNGNEVMFLSDRGLFSIDLFLADARTGKVKRQITKTAVDPHYQSLQFIQSAGGWSPDGRRFAFAGISKGKPVLSLYDVGRGKRDREIQLPTLDEVFNPSWSPDGRQVAFAGLSGGLSDLFVYDLEEEKLNRLTSDAFADLQPVWSPDGRTLAFATDRFTTDLAQLTVGRYAIGLIDVTTGQMRQLPGFEGVRHTNPQWAPDGASLYFIADPDGISNVFRLELAGGSINQVTDLFTGVSGITETSPALSVAQQSGRMVYSVFRANGYELYTIDSPEVLAGRGFTPDATASRTGTLPPAQRRNPTLVDLLGNPDLGLPRETEFAVQPYHGGISLTYVGRPSLVAGSNQFGTFVGGGASLYFSDLLGNHNLVTALQVNGGLKDVTAVVGYQNLSRRVNWGGAIQQIPYVTGRYAQGIGEVNNEPAFFEEQLLIRQTNRDLTGLLSYPFNEVQRIDLQAGFSNISFDRELHTRATSLITGQVLIDDEEDLGAPSSLNLGLGSAALVYDNSFFGATSPILGQRYRLEVAPTFGSLSYIGALADYRKYFMPVRPFTLATRLLHYGRYGNGGEDARLQPLFLGYAGLVRGYSFGSFDGSECEPTPGDPDACPVFDQLLGSRMVVANAELRFPLLGVLGLGSGYYGAFPLEFAAFVDGGLAWDTANDPSVFGSGTRDPVFSAGVGLRINLLGFAVAEVDLVRPFDRPGKGWMWQFELQPGF
ncbi:MAG TPA: BamA/TamA family outer membrane protein [Gemmatimonadales bacterium]|nr:BamA/TamA family outer membrane protein [Gemmatimonadales bacterium]